MAESASVALTSALAAIWAAIRARHPDVPAVVLLPAPNAYGHRPVLGHFAALRWQTEVDKGTKGIHEVVVVAEFLNRSPTDIVGTLLHEAAHAMNFERGVFDCSKSQYHNQHFKSAAEELGLTVTRVPHYGFALTQLSPATVEMYACHADSLQAVLLHRKAEAAPSNPATGKDASESDANDDQQDGSKGGRYKKATCSCPLNIRVSRKVMTTTVIRCENCGDAFMFP